MRGSRAQVVISVQPGDCVLLGTASLSRRVVGSWAFTPSEARKIGDFLHQAADDCEKEKRDA